MRFSRSVRALVFLVMSASPALAAAQPAGDFGNVSITARPPDAVVYIDGERWVTSDTNGALLVQLAPGRHRIEVRAPGHRPFATTVEVIRGETTPLNVSLPVTAGFEDAGPPPAPAPPRQLPPPGPIQQVSTAPSGDGFVFATDFRITELNHRTTGLAGFYGGAVFAGQVMVGGGAYFQLDDQYSEQMAYGGLVAEWRVFHDHPVGLTLHGLAGYGAANVNPYYAGGHGHYNDGRYGYGYGGYGCGYAYRCGPYEGFFIGEPEAQVVARFGQSLRLVGGVGYRFTSADFNNLNGVTGSISIQFGR
jgi:hypothetical protein